MLENLTQFDGELLIRIQELFVSDSLTPVVRFITSLGNGGFIWIAITVILLCFKKTRKAGILSAIAMIASLLINNLMLKNLVDRTRPYETFDAVRRLIPRPGDASFPSGHSANSFAAAVSIKLQLPDRYGIPALVLAFLIALSRLYLGVHYPSDVLFGALSGSLIAYAVYKIDAEREDELRPPKHV